MNNKGFTLIELLATIVILALVVGITVVTVGSLFTNSNDKAEKAFVNQLSSIVEDYITLKNSSFSYSNQIDNSSGKESYFTNNYSYPVKISTTKRNGNPISFKDLIEAGLITEVDLVNPKTMNTCNSNSVITVYRDSNYVYCFATFLDCYVDENGNEIVITNC